MRASIQGDLVAHGARSPADATLPDATGLTGPFSCLNAARPDTGSCGERWGRVTLTSRLSATHDRVASSIASFRLSRQKLGHGMLDTLKATLTALQAGRPEDAGDLRPRAGLLR